ncbi:MULTISPECIES: hypothetical protein [Novosphingobium]|uniref:hypothetical protein n=1 Tax=Novosphingobium sp. ST904 TaxID=1684385 RepID=UPI0010471F1A|nr:hypothetical protein [Novosphingobium sp. ST904]TCM37419.1 hypothetical protein EDF59_111127 [Novosphingobium sp. ST904]
MQQDAFQALSPDAQWTEGQRELAQAVADWRAVPGAAPTLAAMDRFGRGERFEDCQPLSALFTADGVSARTFVDDLVGRVLSVLRRYPLGQLPLRHSRREVVDTVLLAHTGNATLALSLYDERALQLQPAPETVEFAGLETWALVLAGEGQAERIERIPVSDKQAEFHRETVPLRAGTRLYRDGSRQAHQVRSVRGSLVVLRLQRFVPETDAVREYGLADGALIRRAAARLEQTRLDMAMAVLAALGRRDAVPLMSKIALGDGAAELRWQALRAILALDTRAGMVLLGNVAASDDAVLASPAKELRRSLLVQWPELEKVAQWRG